MAKIVLCKGCRQERAHLANGRCAACDRFWRQNGWDKPEHFQAAWDTWNAPLLRFMRLVKHEGSCWEWTGSHYVGYGRFQVDGLTVLATRWIYEQLIGPIPEGLHLDHLCRNPPCVFPGHLEPVTPRENVHRGMRARQAEPHRAPHVA